MNELPKPVPIPAPEEFEGGIKIKPNELPALRDQVAKHLAGRQEQIQKALNIALERYGSARSNLPGFARNAQALEKVDFGSSAWTSLSTKLASALVHENEALARAIFPLTPLSGIENAEDALPYMNAILNSARGYRGALKRFPADLRMAWRARGIEPVRRGILPVQDMRTFEDKAAMVEPGLKIMINSARAARQIGVRLGYQTALVADAKIQTDQIAGQRIQVASKYGDDLTGAIEAYNQAQAAKPKVGNIFQIEPGGNPEDVMNAALAQNEYERLRTEQGDHEASVYEALETLMTNARIALIRPEAIATMRISQAGLRGQIMAMVDAALDGYRPILSVVGEGIRTTIRTMYMENWKMRLGALEKWSDEMFLLPNEVLKSLPEPEQEN